jgi:thiol-disulfide isomerase/thioredoxin
VSGTIQMNDGNKKSVVYLIDPSDFHSLATSYRGKLIDSAVIDKKGRFFFKQMPEHSEKKLYLLTLQNLNEKYPQKLENDHPDHSNYLPFIFQSSSRISITSSAKHFLKDASMSGSVEENKYVIQLSQKRIDLWNHYQNSLQSDLESFLIENEKALFHFQKSLTTSVSDQQDVLVRSLALRWASPSSDYERIPELVRETCQKVLLSDPDHPWTAQICALSGNLPLSPGQTFPDSQLPVLDGDTVNLYSLLGTKITLIDFWASWCAPCRKENKEVLVPLWDTYHKSGFQIIGHALDSSEKGWKNAIEKDGADRWVHTSYLQGDISPLMDVLKITTIPSNYLVDKNGTILAKNLHGEELKNWLINYLE